MLVLSRRQQEQLVFPNLGISVQILRVDGKTVRLGIDAPRDVPVLRGELAQQWTEWRDYPAGIKPAQLSHALRNRLNAASVGLHLLHRQLELGQLENVEATILKIFRELRSMEREVSQASESRRSRDPDHPPRRALVVEDNVNECELLAGFLRSCNFDVVTANDGASALEYLAQASSPDVVLMDMRLPRVDGPTAVQEIRSNPQTRGLKIFAVTGVTQRESGVSVGPHGVDRWFTKPIRPDVLVEEIHRELDKLAPTG